MNFDIIKEAGLTQLEFSQLCGVSRATVCLWVTGRFSPSRYITSTVQRTLQDLQTARERGQLPLPPKVKPNDRLPAIRDALNLRASIDA